MNNDYVGNFEGLHGECSLEDMISNYKEKSLQWACEESFWDGTPPTNQEETQTLEQVMSVSVDVMQSLIDCPQVYRIAK